MHESSSRFFTCRRIVAAFMACIACCVGAPLTQTLAVDYTWTSATTGGSWSVTGNWTPSGGPTSGDTAALTDATVNRTVFYNSAASGSLTGLSFTQTTSGILNELRVQRNLTVTNALVLGASSGTAQLTLLGASAANVTGTFSGGITVNSGGVLSLANFNPAGSASIFNSNLTGNVTVSGGRLDFSWVKEGTATSSANSLQVLTGNLTMSSGTIAFDNPLGTNPDRRLQITGDVSITGGRFTTNATSGVSNIRFDGASILFAPTSYDDARFQINLQATGAQTYSGSTAIQTLAVRGTGIKTVSNSGTITALQMFDGDGTGRSATTLKLASNLTVSTGSLSAATFSQVGTTFDFGVDADTYTLDLTAASGAWTPNVGMAGTGTTAQWALTGNGGRIIANGFAFNSASVGTTVGPGLILESRAGNGAANNLSLGTSGTGAIDPTSVFRYAGSAAVATPSTLASTRAIGILEVTSGALQVSSLPSLAAARVNGGVLIATSSNALPGFGSAGLVTFGGGTLQLPVDGTNWTMTQVDSLLTNATKTSGVLAIDVASGVQTQTGSGYSGGIGLTKLGSGTLTLSAANSYTGTTTISAGQLSLNGGSDRLATSAPITITGGVLDLGSAGQTTSGAISFQGGTVQSGTLTSTGGAFDGQNGTVSAILAGNVGLTKTTTGTLTLSGANTYTGASILSAGALVVNNASALGNTANALAVNGGTLNLNGNSVSVGALSGSSGATISTSSSAGTATLSTSVASGSSTFGGVIQDNGSGRVALTKLGAGTLALTAANSYTGATTIAAGTLALSGGDNRLATGGTVSFTGNGGLNISGSQSLAAVTLSPNVSAAVSGGGRLTLTGASVLIGGSGSQVLDASGLTSFAYSNAAGTMTVSGSNVSVASSAAVVLPASATITAATLGIGSVGNNSAVSSGTLTLGANATIASNAITLGSSQSQGTINVAAGTVNPVLRLRGSDSTSAVPNMTIGTSPGYGLTTASRVDLTGGTGASTLDALVTNLVIGQSTRSTTFSGSISISGGLLMQSGSLTATTITLGQTLNNPTFSASGQVISGSLSVSGGTVNVNTLYLADHNWTSGTVTGIFRLAGGGTLNAGTIASGTGAGAGSSIRTFAWDDGTIANLDASTDLSIGSGITFNLASTGLRRFSIGTGRSGTVASVLAGTGGTLEKSGAGTLVLTASNTYTGTTTVSEGTLRAGSGSALGGSSAALAVNGGTLDLNGFSMTVGALSGSAGGTITTAATSGTTTLTTSASVNATFAGQLADNGAGILALTKLGSGTLTLSAANTYTGTTTISAGQLSLTGGSDRLATNAPITITGGVLDLGSAGQTTSGAISFQGGTVQSGTLTSTGGAFDGQNGTVSAILAGNVGLTKTTTGTLTLSGANTYTGASTLSAGTLVVNNASALGNTANALAVNGGTLNLSGNSVSVGALSGSSAGTITTNSASGTATLTTSVASGLSTFGGVIQDNGSGRLALTKLGSGTLVLAAINTYTGTTSVNAGTLQIGVAGGAAGRVTGDTVVNTGGTLLLRNVSGALGNVAVTGGRLEMTTVNQSIGALSMTSGTVSLGNSGLRLSVTGNASITGGSVVEPGSGGVINFFGATNVFAPQTLSAAYSFQLIASGNQTFSGSTALGALRIRGTGIKTVSNSGTIGDISFVADTAGSPVTLKLGSNLTVGAGGLNLAGFSQQGTSLSFGVDADTYSLDLTAASGAWTPGTGGTGTTALWTLAGTAGRIIANGFDLSSARVDSSVGPGLILESRAGNSGTNNLSVGAGSGTIDSTSVFRYAGTAVAATPATLTSSRAIGDLEVTSGALRITSLAGLQNVRVTGGTLDLGNQSLSVTSGSFGGGSVTSGTLTSSTFLATSGTVGASLAGVGGTLTKTTSGTFVLTGVNTFTGATTIAAGVLGIGDVNALQGTSGVNIGNGAAFGWGGGAATFAKDITVTGGIGAVANAGTGPLTLSGVLANNGTSLVLTSGTFVVDGQVTGAGLGGLVVDAARVTLANALNDYSGPTSVQNAGTLLVNGGLTGLGAVTVDSGATLGGSGSIAGAVTVNGFFSPGTSPGLLSVAALTLGEASTSLFEIDGLTRATQYDGTDVTNLLTYGGSLVIDFGSGITAAFADNTMFNLFDFGSYTGAFTSITTVNDGSFYAGLTFTAVGGGDTWTATNGSQTLEFTHSTGNLAIVPEPGAIALAAIGIAAAVWVRRRRSAP